jgi:hypothetical protein
VLRKWFKAGAVLTLIFVYGHACRLVFAIASGSGFLTFLAAHIAVAVLRDLPPRLRGSMPPDKLSCAHIDETKHRQIGNDRHRVVFQTRQTHNLSQPVHLIFSGLSDAVSLMRPRRKIRFLAYDRIFGKFFRNVSR